MKNALSDSVLVQHMAFLGKTGSGKTSTAKIAVEQIVRADRLARVCILDTVKSDWWGMTSSADGKRAGLPFHILGGPRGHVPLHSSAGKAIGELVGTGALPLSIVDMADFEAGGVSRFFIDFAPALMKRARGVVYLVIEEAHEIAPKERSGIGNENMAIHWAKKLATAGRSKGIRLMVITQRTQALHNALLGSCDTMIAHRLTAPADQEPVKKWLKANVSKSIFDQVSSSLSSLKTGSGWICSGEAQVAELVQFPKITTYDNSATPTGDTGEHAVKTAPVDQDRLRAIIGTAVKESEANDPKALKAEIARLTKEVATKPVCSPSADPRAVADAEQRGYDRGLAEGLNRGERRAKAALTEVQSRLNEALVVAGKSIESLDSPAPAAEPRRHVIAMPTRPALTKPADCASDVSPTVRKILDVIHRSAPVALTFDAASLRAGVSRRSSAYRSYRSQVENSHEVTRRDDGRFTSAPGIAKPIGTGADPIEEFAAKLPSSYARMLRSIASIGGPISKQKIADLAGISPTSSGLGAGLSELIALSLVERDGSQYSIHRDLQ